MKKRLVAILFAGVMSMGLLAGCGGDKAAAPAASTAPKTTASADADADADVEDEGDYEEDADYEEGDAEEGGEAASETQWIYDSGFYVNDGSSDAVICFFASSDGDQVAYLNDGSNEYFAAYDVAEAELDDGTPYMLVQVGGATLGYFTDGSDWYIVDAEGNLMAAAQLSEEEANAILEAVAQ